MPPRSEAIWQRSTVSSISTLANETDAGLGLNGAKNPINAALYVQDKFEWEGLVVNAGLRLDYFDYRTERLRDPQNPLDPAPYGASGTGIGSAQIGVSQLYYDVIGRSFRAGLRFEF